MRASSAFPEIFITPAARELPPYVRVLTTTRVLPKASKKTPETTISDACWPPTLHIQGAALESAFMQSGHALHHFLPAPPLWLQQVHGTDVVKMDHDTSAAMMRQTPPIADAAVTCTPDVVLAILTADCLPVVIACENSLALAVVHAGWRGLADGVLENAVRDMACSTTSLMAWLGPAIGPAAFEVGEEVYAAFDAVRDGEAASCFIPTGVSGKWYADLVALARLRLQRLGISKIGGETWCTYSDTQRFFSYRRQRDEGRMATLAWVAGIRGQESGIRDQGSESSSCGGAERNQGRQSSVGFADAPANPRCLRRASQQTPAAFGGTPFGKGAERGQGEGRGREWVVRNPF
ncbi:MAG: peptidoglycan editing factor PgeF [Burkholderiales bacterium]|jgi:YfiH family protein|nr:peptidoglycan editing factor PgeF [Burkholderiales bacterium]